MRKSIKTLEGKYDKSEDDIKALQSVGQIIAEVLRQLDEDRCQFRFRAFTMYVLMSKMDSHRQGLIGSPLCSQLSISRLENETQAWCSRGSRHDDPYHHAHTASRGRSSRIQHVH